jgi:hypothetical protein
VPLIPAALRRRELRSLPHAMPGGELRLLTGDFDATLSLPAS